MLGLLVLLWVMELHMEHQNKNACSWLEWLPLRGQRCVLSQVYMREWLQLSLHTSAVALVHECQLMEKIPCLDKEVQNYMLLYASNN